MAINVQQIGTELCEALGIDASDVTEVAFCWRPGGLAELNIGFALRDMDVINEVFKKYELVEKETAPVGEPVAADG